MVMEGKSMKSLHNLFMQSVENIGFNEFERSLFYNAPIGIRFEIGVEGNAFLNDRSINTDYISRALYRAKTIYKSLPYKPNILRIDTYPDEKNTPQHITLQNISLLNLQYPSEVVEDLIVDDGVKYTHQHLYWDLLQTDYDADYLIEKIIWADFGDLGGLCSNVYFMNTDNSILFHLYDDRGADVVAKEKNLLKPLYDDFNDWILGYDREKIEAIFYK